MDLRTIVYDCQTANAIFVENNKQAIACFLFGYKK
ncbi:hypothetical protein Ga0466249_002526 [Sporomusaceae bacterium BoRhaA]|nr:hypothetical protein [Pelorhabdus rhamnosifermentans]